MLFCASDGLFCSSQQVVIAATLQQRSGPEGQNSDPLHCMWPHARVLTTRPVCPNQSRGTNAHASTDHITASWFSSHHPQMIRRQGHHQHALMSQDLHNNTQWVRPTQLCQQGAPDRGPTRTDTASRFSWCSKADMQVVYGQKVTYNHRAVRGIVRCMRRDNTGGLCSRQHWALCLQHTSACKQMRHTCVVPVQNLQA